MIRLKRREKTSFKSFHKEFQRDELSSPINRGVTSVDIDKIVGSVGRPLDFSGGFKPKKTFSTYNKRFKSIKDAMEKRKVLPLVELYKVKDEYYVVDGHHRIAAAKQLGMLTIDSHIVEFLPLGDNFEDILYRARTFFEIKTGLQGIILSHRDLYSKLMDEIKRYHKRLESEDKTFTLDESARQWYQNRYKPAVKEIENSGILRFFTDFTMGDFYIYLRKHRGLSSKKQKIDSSATVNNKDLETLTRELSFLLEEDPYLDSDETIKRCEKILPFPLYKKFLHHIPKKENNIRSTKQRIINLLSRI